MTERIPILGITPCAHPDAALVVAMDRAGARGCLDLGYQPDKAQRALERLNRRGRAYGVRVPDGTTAPHLSALVDLLVLPAGHPRPEGFAGTLLVAVTSAEEALAATQMGVDGLVATGHEAAGRVGEESSFVLLQRLLALVDVPVWAHGGIGLHTAAAAIAGGATGLVLDTQLALLDESTLPEVSRNALRRLDGSETRVLGGFRVLDRPGLPLDVLATGLPHVLGAGPLDRKLLPIGQDAALAAPLAARFRDVCSLVHGLQESVAQHLQQAAAHQPLAPGHGLAAAHGMAYPIAQGPMTRVSDRAAFAEAVAEGGGLPFLALSLSRGGAVRKLITETAERLGDHPWGVGLLGFVPPELRAEQLEVIAELRPPVALIAGGRPSQARELEEMGVPTYLHVPSPGLLDMFLDDGARRFVFEGRECGGHIGPRCSFVLWDQLVERLLQDGDPESLHLVFAGGIHDARSAAMVGAMAAPLAARGAKIGALMGTAYLFTQEAITTGAIGEVFQAAALAATHTVAVQTAPGHATRCVRSPFVHAFEARREELEAEGASKEQIWEELEKLNLGRLRIASKGVIRNGDKLETVDTDRQRAEGMFMIGQVAALRSEQTTVAALHHEVSAGSSEILALAGSDAVETERPGPVDIAIVGMAGVFPGAPNIESFWSNLLQGHDAVSEVPAERWNVDTYYDPEPRGGEASRSKWGGFLPPIPFDPLTYGIPPRSLAAIDPVQILALEVCQRALTDAGFDRRDFARERCSVIFGAEAGTDLASAYSFRGLWPTYVGELPAELDAVLPKLTEDSFPGVLANVIAGRVANRLDLGGSNFTVDAACASSLAALDMATRELATGASDVVLCGGADLHNAVGDYLLFSSTHALSARGRCATFDASADGIALGEAVAVVVLKRLADAQRDGDRIYAVVKSVAGSSDGKSLGLTAPRKQGQVRALQRAYRRAGLDAHEVGLIEAHGTGTVVGDRTEMQTLDQVFDGASPGTVTLGSVKSNIGHTKCAAGLAGLIKVALSLHRKVLPPTLHVSQPNSAWTGPGSPFAFRSKPAPWVGDSRHGAVSAFGFGGTNFHTVVSAHGADDTGVAAWSCELFVFRDQASIDATLRHARAEVGPPLRDLARTLSERGEGPVLLAVVATSLADLQLKLQRHTDGHPTPGVFRHDPMAGDVGVLFPGQGSQRPGMLADLFVAFPHLHRHLEAGSAWLDVLFPPDAFTAEDRAAQKLTITDTRVAQPTLGMTGLAAWDLLCDIGLPVHALAGHSYGELVALAAAGALPSDRLLELSEARGRCILAAAGDTPGTMLAAAAGEDQVLLAIGGLDVALANHNAPDQTVLSGTVEAIAEAEAALIAAEIAVRRFPVAAAFHSPVVQGAMDLFAAELENIEISEPRLPVYANVTAAPHEASEIAATLAAHLASPVRWTQLIERMYADGVRIFVEAGPGKVLTRLVGRILGDRPHLAVPLAEDSDAGLEGLLHLTGALMAAGVPVDPIPLFAGRGCRRVDLDAPPATHSATTWLVNGHRAVPLHGEAPDYALSIVESPMQLTSLGSASAGNREAVLLEYLRGMRELAESQRQIMLGYLGQPQVAAMTLDAVQVPVVASSTTIQPAALVTTEPAPMSAVSAGEALLAIVSDRTGYPADMLDLDLDLEADLSIDSIKRIEILGALSETLGLAEASQAERDELVEELARVKTLRGILDWIQSRADSAPAEAAPAPQTAPAQLPEDGLAPPEHTERFIPALEAAPINGSAGGPLHHRHVAVVGVDSPIARAVIARLDARGGAGTLAAPGDALDEVDGIVWLGALGSNEAPGDSVIALADTARRVLSGGNVPFVNATGGGGLLGVGGLGSPTGGGVAGLTRSLAHEWPDIRLRRVDLDPDESPETLADHLLDELIAKDSHREVGYRAGVRHTLSSVSAPLEPTSKRSALPVGGVLLVTGGARGITARVTVALAERYQPILELVGRSPQPGPANPELDASDENALRAQLIKLGLASNPAEASRLARRELADREMRETFTTLDELGVRWRYHALDVRDTGAFGALIDQLYSEHGRLDGVVHGAGVTEDKLLRDKTPESFRRVYDTKVNAALTMASKLHDDLSLAVFFSSVAGAFGNRGQTDYAAANATLDALARQLDARIEGRAVSINWGPWGGGGMVSADLEREYNRRGIALIEPADGIAQLLAEIEAGSGSQVILMRAQPEHMVPRST